MQVVDVVLGLAITRQQALDRQLRILRPLPGETAERVVEDQFDRRPRHRLALPEPLKITSCIDSPRNSEAFDSPSTQRTESITLDLPQPFGPTTPTSCPGSAMRRRIDEGFEAGKFQFGQAHEPERGRYSRAPEEIGKSMVPSECQPAPGRSGRPANIPPECHHKRL
jgi:hypothetical protein